MLADSQIRRQLAAFFCAAFPVYGYLISAQRTERVKNCPHFSESCFPSRADRRSVGVSERLGVGLFGQQGGKRLTGFVETPGGDPIGPAGPRSAEDQRFRID
jgi:hypothetical protein